MLGGSVKTSRVNVKSLLPKPTPDYILLLRPACLPWFYTFSGCKFVQVASGGVIAAGGVWLEIVEKTFWSIAALVTLPPRVALVVELETRLPMNGRGAESLPCGCQVISAHRYMRLYFHRIGEQPDVLLQYIGNGAWTKRYRNP